jgi:hypothetical protein
MPKPETPERNVLFKAEENSLSVAVLQYALLLSGKVYEPWRGLLCDRRKVKWCKVSKAMGGEVGWLI